MSPERREAASCQRPLLPNSSAAGETVSVHELAELRQRAWSRLANDATKTPEDAVLARRLTTKLNGHALDLRRYREGKSSMDGRGRHGGPSGLWGAVRRQRYAPGLGTVLSPWLREAFETLPHDDQRAIVELVHHRRQCRGVDPEVLAVWSETVHEHDNHGRRRGLAPGDSHGTINGKLYDLGNPAADMLGAGSETTGHITDGAAGQHDEIWFVYHLLVVRDETREPVYTLEQHRAALQAKGRPRNGSRPVRDDAERVVRGMVAAGITKAETSRALGVCTKTVARICSESVQLSSMEGTTPHDLDPEVIHHDDTRREASYDTRSDRAPERARSGPAPRAIPPRRGTRGRARQMGRGLV
jgi:hypothetical protein